MASAVRVDTLESLDMTVKVNVKDIALKGDIPPPYKPVIPPSSIVKVQNIESVSHYPSGLTTFKRDGKLWQAVGNSGDTRTSMGMPQTSHTFFHAQQLHFPGMAEDAVIKSYGGDGYAIMFCLFETGECFVWGRNSHGQTGLDKGTTDILFPELLTADVDEVFELAGPGTSTQFLGFFLRKKDNSIWGAGNNNMLELDSTSTGDISKLKEIAVLSNDVKQYFNGSGHYGWCIAVKNDGSIFAAGYNAQGQLGDGTNNSPVAWVEVSHRWGGKIDFAGGETVDVLFCQNWDSRVNSLMYIVRKKAGKTTIWASGYGGYGGLGQGNTTNVNIPVKINISDDIKQFFATPNGLTTCSVILNNGDYFSWGYNVNGQCGDGTTTNVTTPKKVYSNVRRVLSDWRLAPYEAQYQIPIFLELNDESVVATGYNAYGKCGVNLTATNVTTFNRVVLPKVKIKFMGRGRTESNGDYLLFITDTNRVFACGYLTRGILEVDSPTTIIPVEVKLPVY